MRPPTPPSLAVFLVVLAAAGWVTSAPANAQIDGSPDPSFSGDGILSDGNEPFSIYSPRALAVLPNQEVVVVGDLTQTLGMDHLRVNVAGNALADCQAGILLLDEFEGLAVLVDRTGRLVVAGRSTFSGAPDQQRGLIGRFTASNSCVFDTGWSGNGWQILDGESFCDTEDCAVLDVAESPTSSARLYALLSSQVNLLVSRLFVVGFRADGTLDDSFGVDGYAEVTASELGTLSGVGAQLVVDGRGRPLVLATRWDPDVALDADAFLARFTEGGDLDVTFGDEGVEVVDDTSGIDSFPAGLTLGSAGQIAFGVNLDSGNGTGLSGVMRPDESRVSGLLPNCRIAAVTLQGDGKLLVLVDDVDDDGMHIVRLLLGQTLEPDPAFGTGGIASLDVDLGGDDWQQATAMVLSTGRPWLVGRADGDSGAGMFAMRLRNRYVFADGFEIGSTSFWRR